MHCGTHTPDIPLIYSRTAIVPGTESEIMIFKGTQMLGLSVVGGSDTYLSGIYVDVIVPQSPAAKDGRLKAGDRIMKVIQGRVRSLGEGE